MNSSATTCIMKFLVLAACVCQSLAAPQGFYGLQGHPNGAVTPIDEPRVAAARADHLATKYGALPAVAAVPAVHAAAPIAHAAPVAVAHAAPIHVPSLVAHPNGAVVPADEPAVAAARADHLASHGVAAPVAAYAHAPVAVAHAAPIHVPSLA